MKGKRKNDNNPPWVNEPFLTPEKWARGWRGDDQPSPTALPVWLALLFTVVFWGSCVVSALIEAGVL